MAAKRRDDDAQPESEHALDEDEAFVDESRPAQRLEQQALWVDHQVRQAIARGEFDDLPGAGKPIKGIDAPHDPQWWVKNLIEREELTGLGPPAIMLRKEDAELDDRLDRISAEPEVRRVLADFNARVVNARRQLRGGPPVVTPTRDIAAVVDAGRARRVERLRSLRAEAQTPWQSRPDSKKKSGRRWWRRRDRS
jgi:hypothetical protein